MTTEDGGGKVKTASRSRQMHSKCKAAQVPRRASHLWRPARTHGPMSCNCGMSGGGAEQVNMTLSPNLARSRLSAYLVSVWKRWPLSGQVRLDLVDVGRSLADTAPTIARAPPIGGQLVLTLRCPKQPVRNCPATCAPRCAGKLAQLRGNRVVDCLSDILCLETVARSRAEWHAWYRAHRKGVATRVKAQPRGDLRRARASVTRQAPRAIITALAPGTSATSASATPHGRLGAPVHRAQVPLSVALCGSHAQSCRHPHDLRHTQAVVEVQGPSGRPCSPMDGEETATTTKTPAGNEPCARGRACAYTERLADPSRHPKGPLAGNAPARNKVPRRPKSQQLADRQRRGVATGPARARREYLGQADGRYARRPPLPRTKVAGAKGRAGARSRQRAQICGEATAERSEA